MGSKQYKYLDFLKVMAMCFVCMYHFWHGSARESSGILGFLQTYSYSILSTCVPLFFAVNGALLLNRESFDGKKHFQKLLTIFLQFIVWHGITTVILGLQAGVAFTSWSKHQLLNVFLLLETPTGVDLDHLWFVPILCGIYLLYPFIRSVFVQEHQEHGARISLVCLLAVVYFVCFFLQDAAIFKNVSPYLMYFNTDSLLVLNPFSFRIGTMLTYFLIGGFLHRYREQAGKIPAVVLVLMMLVGLLVSYGIVILKPGFDIVFGGYSSTGTLLCTVSLFLLVSRMEEKLPSEGAFHVAVKSVGRNTMTIYYTHWILGYLLLAFMGYGCFWNLLKTAVFVISGTLLAEMMKRIPLVKYLVH